MNSDAIAAAGFLTALIGLGLQWRQRIAFTRDNNRLREESERCRFDCLQQLKLLDETWAGREQNMQATLELLRDGRLGFPVRSRALRLLGSGMSAASAARELGLAESELRLLDKVSAVLTSRQ